MAEITDDRIRFVDRESGKNSVRVVYVRQEERRHLVVEMTISSAITWTGTEEFVHGDNSEVIATDTHKNIIYILAKRHGIRSIEEFACQLSDHFLHQYDHVIRTNIYMVTAPQVQGGIKNLTLMKTTQSAFVDFLRDEYTTLPYMEDRVWRTAIEATWTYEENAKDADYGEVWETVSGCITSVFCGPADTGTLSTGVPKTVYDMQKLILQKITLITDVKLTLQNLHAVEFDFSDLPAFTALTDGHVYVPTEQPSGRVSAHVRKWDK